MDSHDAHFAKKDLQQPWIHCLWCSYKDTIDWDLAQHMYEKHRGGKNAYDKKLLELPISSEDRKKTLDLMDVDSRYFAKFEPAIEFRLEVALMMAKNHNRNAGIKHAIRQVQKQILRRQQESEKAKEAADLVRH